MTTITIERTDTAASARPQQTTTREPQPTTGSFRTVQPTLEVTAPLGERYEEILTPEALDFLAALHDRFAHPRH